MTEVGGNPNVVIHDPDIVQFKIQPDKHDFIVIGCDGIFDKMDSKDTVHTIWQASMAHISKANNFGPNYEQNKDKASPQYEDSSSHKLCRLAVDALLKVSAIRRTVDNITVVVIGFDNFVTKLE
jgi:serine/threonine protein phosphatase PrpC